MAMHDSRITASQQHSSTTGQQHNSTEAPSLLLSKELCFSRQSLGLPAAVEVGDVGGGVGCHGHVVLPAVEAAGQRHLPRCTPIGDHHLAEGGGEGRWGCGREGDDGE